MRASAPCTAEQRPAWKGSCVVGSTSAPPVLNDAMRKIIYDQDGGQQGRRMCAASARRVTAAPRGADRRGVRADADQLPEQGAGRVQHVHRVAHLLRHVHRRDHHRLLHHVPGAPRLFNT